MTASLMTATDINVSYPGAAQPSVAGVNFSLAPGRTLAVIGESGAGKTTLALAIAGLLGEAAAIEGTLLFEGRDLLSLDEEQRCEVRGKGIGMIFQDPRASLDPTMKVIDQVAEPLRVHQGMSRRAARSAARKLLHSVNLTDDLLANAPYPHQLSGGLCQRVSIAAALACDPRLLIADEPTSSLDLTLQSQVIELIKQRQRDTDLAVIFITHDLALAAAVGNEIAVMYGGVFVEMGQAAELLRDPNHPYTRELVEIWSGNGDSPGAAHATA